MSKSVCPLYGDECAEEIHAKCREIFMEYAKVVWCKDDRCVWNKSLDNSKTIKHHKAYVPLGTKDAYAGICTRPEIGLTPDTVETRDTKRVLTSCDFRSNKGISGHLDFSKYPQGGNIPDPVDPGTAYHV